MNRFELATLCYVRNNGKTLMLHRKKEGDMHKGFYVALGGKIESGESPEECVTREVKEESRLNIINPQLRGIITFSNKGRSFRGKKQPDWYVFVYVATKLTGTLRQPKEGVLEWVADEQLTSLPMWEGDKVFTTWIDKPGIFSGKLEYKDEKLVNHKVKFY